MVLSLQWMISIPRLSELLDLTSLALHDIKGQSGHFFLDLG